MDRNKKSRDSEKQERLQPRKTQVEKSRKRPSKRPIGPTTGTVTQCMAVAIPSALNPTPNSSFSRTALSIHRDSGARYSEPANRPHRCERRRPRRTSPAFPY